MNLNFIKTQAQHFISENSTTLLTAAGAAGTIVTGVLAGRASFKAAQVLAEKQEIIDDSPKDLHYDTVQKVKDIGPMFIPPVVVGGLTVASIIMANRMNAQRIAALAAAYSLSENRLKDYQTKVQEKLTGPKNQGVYDEIAQDKVNANQSSEVLILGGSDVLCFDMFTGRYFSSTMDNLKRAENSTNAEMFNHQYASLSHFYDEIGLPPTTFTDELGWNTSMTGPLELRFSTVMDPTKQKPCIAIDFVNPPRPEFRHLY